MKGLARHKTWLIPFLAISLAAGTYYVGVKGESRSAFNRWRPMLHELVQGTDIYEKFNFPTPPVMGLILYPFANLPGRWAMAAWFGFKVLLTAVSVLFLIRTIEQTRSTTRHDDVESPQLASPPDLPTAAPSTLSTWLILGVLALSARPILGDLLHGNVNLWILFLICVALCGMIEGRPAICGLSCALAAACKLTPGLIGLYLVWKRQWRASAWFAAGLVLWLFVVPGVILGHHQNTRLLQSWTKSMVQPFLIESQIDTEQVNQSMPALVFRLFTESMAIKPDDGRPPIEVNLARLGDNSASLLVLVLSVLILATLAWHCWPSQIPQSRIETFHEVSLVLLAMLLLSERTWKHHFVTLLPSYFVLAVTARQWMKWHGPSDAPSLAKDRTWANRMPVLIWSAIGFSQIAIALTSTDLASPFLGQDGAKYVQAYGAYTWSAIALSGAHLASLRSLRHRHADHERRLQTLAEITRAVKERPKAA